MLPTEILQTAASQHGVFSRHQAYDRGVTRWRLQRACGRGELSQLSPRVYRVMATAETDRTRLTAAVLDHGPGAAASHRSAAAMWELPGFRLDLVHVLTQRGERGAESRLGVSHTSRWLSDWHLTVLDGIPVTTPTRTIYDLSGRIPRAKLERTLDAAWSRRLTSMALLEEMHDDLARRGRPKTRLMRQLLDARGPDYVAPESSLESRVEWLARRAGIETLRRQVDVGDADNWLGRMDFVDAEVPLIVEVDGDRFHAALIDREADRAKTAALEASGYVVLRIPEFDVWNDGPAVQRALSDARKQARDKGTPRLHHMSATCQRSGAFSAPLH